MSYIYAIGPSSGPYKIGRSANPSDRLAALQTGYHSPLSIVALAPCDEAQEVERDIHTRLRYYQLSGEWFRCPLSLIVETLLDFGLKPTIKPEGDTTTSMSAESFSRWLEEMARRPFFADDAQCANLLGVSANAVVTMKQRGTDMRTALACRALLHRLEPYA